MEELSYKGNKVKILFDPEISELHVAEDFKALTDYGIDRLIKEKFIPWLQGNQFLDRDINLVFEGLKPYEVNYYYGKIIDKYSPTKETDFFGHFEICFESSSEYTSDMLVAVAMQIYVLKGQVVKVSGYDI